MMRARISIALLAAAGLLLFGGCDDQVSPKTGDEEIYVINCVLNPDTSYQVATVTRSYDVPGLDPYDNTTEPSVAGAVITISWDGGSVTLRDSVMQQPAGSRYTSTRTFYYVRGFQPRKGVTYNLSAQLPDGEILTGSTTVPDIGLFYFTYATGTLPESIINYSWQYNYTTMPRTFAPQLFVTWYKKEDQLSRRRSMEIPLFYIPQADTLLPRFPNISGSEFIYYDSTAFEYTMRFLSAGDTAKSQYVIDKAIFELLIPDESLARFASAARTFNAAFTVKLNAPDLTNIVGGRGVFGSYEKKRFNVNIFRNYILSLGYTPLVDLLDEDRRRHTGPPLR